MGLLRDYEPSFEALCVTVCVQAVHDLSDLGLKAESLEADGDSLNHNVYMLEVGRNIDLAFMVLACHAMDLMFWDEGYD